MRHLKRSGGSHTAGTLLLQTRKGNSDPNDVKLTGPEPDDVWIR